MYPNITIDKEKLIANLNRVLEMAKTNHIDHITMVVKAFAGCFEVVRLLKETSLSCIGDSRIENLKRYRALGFKHQMLLRLPMLSEIKDVVRYADISLNAELETIEALNEEAKRQNKKHQIMLMFDVGDLREGLYYTSDYLPIVECVLTLSHIQLGAIGTNLTCYGGVVPSQAILTRLVNIKENIEDAFGINIPIVSGGNSSTVTLFNRNEIPKAINHLRLGESILFGKETSYGNPIEGLHHDVFECQAELIEVKEKPSYPDGEISINSFGEKPNIIDRGLMKRGLLAIGKQDVIFDNLTPKDSHVSIVGGSSDHLIVDLTNTNYQIGDIIRFDINYPALVHLMNSDYIKKIIK